MRRVKLARPAAVIAGLLGFFLVGLAIPRMMASLAVAPYENVLDRNTAGDPVSLGELTEAIRGHEAALRWHKDTVVLFKLAQLHFAVATSSPFGSREREIFLEKSITVHRAALNANPAEPFAWTQLALSVAELDSLNQRLPYLLGESVRSGPDLRPLVLPRLALGLSIWGDLNAELRRLVLQQLWLAADKMPDELAILIEGYRMEGYQLTPLLCELLAERPELRRNIDESFANFGMGSGCGTPLENDGLN